MNPLDLFVGRREQIQAFEKLLEPSSSRWVMLVRGLSGTGKSLLIAWLQQNRCGGIPNAKVQLTPNTTASDFMRVVAAQLGPEYRAELDRKLEMLDEAERQSPFVSIAATMTMESKLAGKIADSSQTTHMPINLGSAAEMEQVERETKRLDAFLNIIGLLKVSTWFLFVDETEHLEGRDFGRFLRDRLVPRLHGRFPGFRLYLSGQAMLERLSFAPHESVLQTLEELRPEETSALLEKAGFSDDVVKAKIMELTLGHPLLLGMIIEDSSLDAETFGLQGHRVPPNRLDQQAVVSWIYRRIVDRLPKGAQLIAEDIVLFDWFDLGILRVIFETEITDAVFRDLIRRSFVKQVAPSQWRCHDIVRRHLATERRAVNPQAVADVCQRAHQAFISQMETRGEREGTPFFPGRLEYIRGALVAAIGYSARTAESLVRREFMTASVQHTADYLLGLIRLMDMEASPPDIRKFGKNARRWLERLRTGRVDKATVAFTEELAVEVADLEHGEARKTLRTMALEQARNCGAWEQAVRLGHELVREESTTDNKLLLATVIAEAGSVKEAEDMFDGIRRKAGDSVAVLTALGNFHQILGNNDQAKRHFTDAIAAAPNGAEQARLQLAAILCLGDRNEEALIQVERLLEITPKHEAAQRLRTTILIGLGRYQSLSLSEGGATGSLFRDAEDFLAHLSTTASQGEIVTALAEDLSDVATNVLLDFGELVAARGDEEALSKMHDEVLKRAPAAYDLVELQKISLLIITNRSEQALNPAKQILERRSDLPGGYLLLSQIYQKLDKFSEAREILVRLAEAFPGLQDKVDRLMTGTWLMNKDTKGALGYLQERADKDSLGPEARIVQAQILAASGKVESALEVLELVVFTAGRSELSVSDMIVARNMFGLLSTKVGKPEQARSIAESLLDQFPQNSTAIGGAADIFATLGDERKIQLLVSDHEKGPPILRAALLGSLSMLVLQRYPDADKLITAIEKEPNRNEFVMAALTLVQSLPAEQGTKIVERLAEITPDTVMKIHRLSMDAMASDPKLLQVVLGMLTSPNLSPIVRIGLILALTTRKSIELERARQELRAIREQNPGLVNRTLSVESDLLLDADKVDEVGALLTPYLETDMIIEPLVLQWARYLKMKDGSQAGADFLGRAAAAFPNQKRLFLEIMVDMLISHDAEQALKILAEMEREAPLSPGQWISRANALGTIERYKDALDALNQALQNKQLTAKERSTLLKYLGNWQIKDNCVEDAVDNYQKALELVQNDAELLIGLSKALEQLERWPEAYTRLRDAIALEPERLTSVENRLHQLRARFMENPELPVDEG